MKGRRRAVTRDETLLVALDSGMPQAARGPWYRALVLAAYVGMLGGSLAVFLLIRSFGKRLVAAPGAVSMLSAHAPGGGVPHVLIHVLAALASVMLVSRALAPLFKRLHQPAVVGEIAAGLLLGPSFLGHFATGVSEQLLPASALPALSVVAQLGVVLYMFLVGLELDLEPLHRSARSNFAISHASIVVPFLLGSTLALYLYPRLSSGVPFTGYALFMGVSMSVTAFPVLARILTALGIRHTAFGANALACAAADDASAWCLLAIIVSVTRSQSGAGLSTVGLAAAYVAGMFLLAKPLLTRWVRAQRGARTTRAQLALVLSGLLLSALATESIGLHAIFGAFAFGAIIPHDCALARQLVERMEDFVAVLLLPAFFAVTGMRTQLALVSSLGDWAICLAIIAVASVGKFGGAYTAARLAGYAPREGAILGLLMNTRGLMELIVLNVGLDLGVISAKLFSMMVIMALVTTLATTPCVQFILGRGSSQRIPLPRSAELALDR